MNQLFQKRSDLILDYISQILVYGSNTKGTLTLSPNEFEDGNYLVLTVSVIKNSYFRWHDLGIAVEDSLSFYQAVYPKIVEKFSKFEVETSEKEIIISSKVNQNQIGIQFHVDPKEHKKWSAWIKNHDRK